MATRSKTGEKTGGNEGAAKRWYVRTKQAQIYGVSIGIGFVLWPVPAIRLLDARRGLLNAGFLQPEAKHSLKVDGSLTSVDGRTAALHLIRPTDLQILFWKFIDDVILHEYDWTLLVS